MANFFSQPLPLEPSSTLEVLEAHQVTYEFYEEVRYRQEFDAYCQWYYQVAEQHRRELHAMKNDINILGWFCRGR